MKLISKLLLFSVLLSTSCVSDKKAEQKCDSQGVIVVDINPKKIDNGKIHEIIEDISFVPLETPEEAILGSISKVEIKNDKIFIKDKVSEEIKIFNLSGKYIGKIANHHRGPGGYNQVSDFAVSEDGNTVEVYDNRNFKFLLYGLDNKFLSERKIKYMVRDFIMGKDEKRIVYTGFSPSYQMEEFPLGHRLLFCKNEKIYDRKLKYNDDLSRFTRGNSNFYRVGDTLGLIELASNNVYYIHNDKVKLKYKIDFGSFNCPVSNTSSKDQIHKYVIEGQKTKSAHVREVLETDEYLYVNYGFDGYSCFSLYNKKTYIKYNAVGFFDDYENMFTPPFPIVTHNGNFIGIKDAYGLAKHIQNLVEKGIKLPIKLKALKDKVTPSSNPVLVFLKFKK